MRSPPSRAPVEGDGGRQERVCVCVTPSASRAAPFKPHSICRSDGKWARGAQHRAPRFSVSGLSNNHSDGPARGLSAPAGSAVELFSAESQGQSDYNTAGFIQHPLRLSKTGPILGWDMRGNHQHTVSCCAAWSPPARGDAPGSGCSVGARFEPPWPGLIARPAFVCCGTGPPRGHSIACVARSAGLHPLRISLYARAAGSLSFT